MTPTRCRRCGDDVFRSRRVTGGAGGGERRGLQVIDATCPLVTKVHNEVNRFARRDDEILLIGHDGHEEVEGTWGEAPDHVQVVDGDAAVDDIVVRDDQS